MLSAIFFLFLALVAGIWFLSFIFSSSKSQKRNIHGLPLPPGPKGLPLLGNLHMLGDLPHRSLQKMAEKYGSIMYIRLGLAPTIVVSSSEAAEQFLKSHDIIFSSRTVYEACKGISYGGKGLVFAPYGPYWRNMRKLCTVHLLSHSKNELFRPIRREETQHFIESIKHSAESHSEIDLTARVGSLVEDITYRMVFGFKDDKFNLKAGIEEAVMLTGVFNVADYIPQLRALDLQGIGRRMRKINRTLDRYLEEIIDDHVKDAETLQGQHRDFIDVMLSLMETEGNLDRENIKAITMDMLAAAMDTTATVIGWTIAELLKHPNVMVKVQHELKAVVGLNRTVEESDLGQLEYMKMVINESMRLHPVIPLIHRESNEDITIDGYFLPKKSRTLINVWAIGRDPRVWSSNAEEFYPERFMGTTIDAIGNGFQFLPFGSGRRRCPGQLLASSVVELVVAQLLHCFDLKLPDGFSPDDLDMSEKFGLSVPRAKNLVVIPTHRLEKLM
ncbi:hypothetical protein ACHQM5_025510 [Ranunculus cassubicifolius]